MTTTETAILRALRAAETIDPCSSKVWIDDVIVAVKAATKLPRLTIRCVIVDMWQRGELDLCRCDMPAEFAEVFGADRVSRSRTDIDNATWFHFVVG